LQHVWQGKSRTRKSPDSGSKTLRSALAVIIIRDLVAQVVELVDTLDLGSSAARRESSSLSIRTI
jgi:hypothetical protein